jgi:maltoporin
MLFVVLKGSSMRDFLVQLKELKRDSRNTKAWLLLVRNYYLVEPYMEAFVKAGYREIH